MGLVRATLYDMIERFIRPGQLFLDDTCPLPLDRPFTNAEAPASSTELTELVRRGYLRRVLRGVYAATQLPDTLAMRARALSLVVSPGAVVTDRTAAWLHGVDVLLPNQDLEVPPVSVFHRAKGGRLRRPEVTSGQRLMRVDDVQEIDGVLVTTPLRTACDLGRTRNRDQAFGAMEAMVRWGVDRDDVLLAQARYAGYRHVCQLRAFAPLMDPRSGSIAESITRLRWFDTSEPRPELQRPVIGPDGQTWSLDLGIDELFFAVEYDGIEFHEGEENEEHDLKRRSWVVKNTPWTIQVVTKDNIFGERQDFHLLLPGWIAEARRTLPKRLAGRRWYDEIGD